MKSIIRKVKANIRSICQLIGLIIIGLLPSLMNVTSLVVKQPELVASQNWFDYIFYYVWKKGNVALGILLFVIALFQVRKANKGCLFNKGDEYKNYPYIWYWICAKILGYSECNLILVPINMQLKLVIRDTFEKYYCGKYQIKEKDVISVNRFNYSNQLDEVNLMISDTYELDINQIPTLKFGKPTILISRDNASDHNRYDSPQLVQSVVNEVRNLPDSVKYLNVYTTTNPLNTMNIGLNAFKLGERGNLDCITVFQQLREGNPRMFSNKGKKIYTRY